MSSEDPSKQTILWHIAEAIYGNNALVEEQRYKRLQACAQLERAYEHCELRRRRLKDIHPKDTVAAVAVTNNLNEDKETAGERLQDSRNGLKISRFFNWGLSHDRSKSTVSSLRGLTIHNKSNTDNEQLGDNSSLLWSPQGSKQGWLGVGMDNIQDQVTPSASKTMDAHIPMQEQDSSNDFSCQREIHAIMACRALSLGCGSDLVQLKRCFQAQGPDPFCFYHLPSSPLPQENSMSKQDCSFYQRQVATCVTEKWKALYKKRRQLVENVDSV